MFLEFAESVGRRVLEFCDSLGAFCLFFGEAIKTLFTTKLRVRKLFSQMNIIGVQSIVIIILTGGFSGAVLALQIYTGLNRFGAEDFIGQIVGFSLTRELGPVLTGLMVTGRAGSAITAELGTMRITEQLDALQTLCINRFQYLIVPRILGSIIILPFLVLFSMIFGIWGGYLICVYVLKINGTQYIESIQRFLELSDITAGLIKATVFGLILSLVCCYKGFNTQGGAKGVGIATTKSVVASSISILIANYFLAALLF